MSNSITTNQPGIEPAELNHFLRKSILITAPLSSRSASEKVAVMRAAIESGEDVNQFDTHPHLGFNEGRPLDACVNTGHMGPDFDVRDNLPAIKLLLEHGADPRLKVATASMWRPPIVHAQRCAANVNVPEEKPFWDDVVKLFEEAILKLEAKGETLEVVLRKNREYNEAMGQIYKEEELRQNGSH